MVFSSLIFLFAFLALNLVVYLFVPQRLKNPTLLVFSLVFYAWGAPPFVLLLAGETFVSWLCALAIERSNAQFGRRLFMVLECVILLGLLAYFKYAGFFMSNVAAILNAPDLIPDVILPIGISFYTFQLISYVADVYRGQVAAQPRYWKLLLYSSLFYQCIAGPIVRYETVAEQIDNRHVTQEDLYEGVRRFCIGLAKKAVLANSCAAVADTLLPIGGEALATQSMCGVWLGMVFYMFQIYFDFSAYSDMAIGMGRMVGFRFLENFRYPYIATSVQDFWRRWHISLSSFFRDYVYIPLGGSRCSKAKYVRNMTIVWLLTGFWHGASWNYILWGLFYLVFLLLEKFVIRDRMPRPIGHVYTLLVVLVGWILFRFENFAEMGTVLAGFFGFGAGGFIGMEVQTAFMQNVFLFIFCIIACTPLGKWLRSKFCELAERSSVALTVYKVGEVVLPIAMLLVAIVALAGASYNPFIYFQF